MSNQTTPPPELTPPPQYVRAQRLLELLWDESCRPSLRSLRNWQKKRIVPHIKVGNLVFFDPLLVRLSLQERFAIRGKR